MFLSLVASAAKAEIVAALRAQGFQCTSGVHSTRCRGKIKTYSQPVDLYVPSYFVPSKPVLLAFHFMGYWTQSDFNPFTKENGDYGTYLAASGANAILILPESKGADTTYSRELNTDVRIATFFKAIETLLGKAGVTTDESTARVLSGHSGAYMFLGQLGTYSPAQVPALRGVRGFALFDCGYSARPGLARFLGLMRSNGGGLFFSAYSPSNSPSKLTTMLALQKELGSAPDVQFVQDKNTSHMAFMREYLTEFLALASGAKRN